VQAVGESWCGGKPVKAGDLLEEGTRLEYEEVVLPMTDARKVHGQPARDVRVVRADENLPVTVDPPRWGVVGDCEIRRPGQVEGSGPPSHNTSKPKPFGRPNATLETEKVPTVPFLNVAVKVTTSSFSTGSRVSLTATVAEWPTAVPSGIGRSGINVDRTLPRMLSTGPQRNSPRSIRWLPMSESAPEPKAPLYRQLIGASLLNP
jgi:hypothetical protein